MLESYQQHNGVNKVQEWIDYITPHTLQTVVSELLLDLSDAPTASEGLDSHQCHDDDEERRRRRSADNNHEDVAERTYSSLVK